MPHQATSNLNRNHLSTSQWLIIVSSLWFRQQTRVIEGADEKLTAFIGLESPIRLR
jgi:hypothetical protein